MLYNAQSVSHKPNIGDFTVVINQEFNQVAGDLLPANLKITKSFVTGVLLSQVPQSSLP